MYWLFQAYHDWLTKHGDEEEYALPSLHYTNDQLFFIGYAQVCGLLVYKLDAIGATELFTWSVSSMINSNSACLYFQEYCSHARPKTEYISTLSEIHAPPKFRHVFKHFHFYKWL